MGGDARRQPASSQEGTPAGTFSVYFLSNQHLLLFRIAAMRLNPARRREAGRGERTVLFQTLTYAAVRATQPFLDFSTAHELEISLDRKPPADNDGASFGAPEGAIA